MIVSHISQEFDSLLSQKGTNDFLLSVLSIGNALGENRHQSQDGKRKDRNGNKCLNQGEPSILLFGKFHHFTEALYQPVAAKRKFAPKKE